MVKGDVRIWLIASRLKQGMRFQLSANKRCLSAPDTTSLHQEQAAKTDILSVVSIQVLCTEEGVANACV